jgi:hypothetical protein
VCVVRAQNTKTGCCVRGWECHLLEINGLQDMSGVSGPKGCEQLEVDNSILQR